MIHPEQRPRVLTKEENLVQLIREAEERGAKAERTELEHLIRVSAGIKEFETLEAHTSHGFTRGVLWVLDHVLRPRIRSRGPAPERPVAGECRCAEQPGAGYAPPGAHSVTCPLVRTDSAYGPGKSSLWTTPAAVDPTMPLPGAEVDPAVTAEEIRKAVEGAKWPRPPLAHITHVDGMRLDVPVAVPANPTLHHDHHIAVCPPPAPPEARHPCIECGNDYAEGYCPHTRSERESGHPKPAPVDQERPAEYPGERHDGWQGSPPLLTRGRLAPSASSECPVCGVDQPHGHSKEDVWRWVNARLSAFGYHAEVQPVGSTESAIRDRLRRGWDHGYRDARDDIDRVAQHPASSDSLNPYRREANAPVDPVREAATVVGGQWATIAKEWRAFREKYGEGEPWSRSPLVLRLNSVEPVELTAALDALALALGKTEPPHAR